MGVWVKLRGRKHGPYDDSQLQTMVRQGKVGRHNEISLDGESWIPASDYAPLWSFMKGNDRQTNQTVDDNLTLSTESSSNGSRLSLSKEWFVSNDGITGTGPYTQSEVMESIRSGKMSLSWLAWKEGGEAKSLKEYPEFQNNNSDEVVQATVADSSLSLIAEKDFCSACQYPLSADSVFCPRCGKKRKKQTSTNTESSTYSVKRTKGLKRVPCRFCGKEISPKLPLCPFCHSILDPSQRKSRLTYILLGLLVVGWFGAHNFYAGRKEVAIRQLCLGLTVIGLVFTIIWAIIDVFTVRQDGKGLPFIEIE
ncbi:MAG: NINE protein [Planctomycetia bacterium]|nr:NINE protein [Planctomycetia bacterium]